MSFSKKNGNNSKLFNKDAANLSKSTSGMPDVSSSDMGPRRQN
jgi:hypothetical protein